MRFSRKLGFVLLSACLTVAALPLTAAADPINVVSGTINYNWGDNAFVTGFTGAGFSASGQFGIGGSSEAYYPPYACSNCGGSSINASLTESFVDRGDDAFTAIVFNVNGQQFLTSAMSFVITAGNVMVPPSIDGGPSVWSTTAPFQFSGWFEGRPWDNVIGDLGGASRRVNLTGSGTVRMAFGENHWWSSTYSFQPSAAPVPEPGTLLLIATAMVGVARRGWTRLV